MDPETGKVTILRYTASQDVGTAIHPSYVEGQIQGGVAQGIGWGLNEEYVYDDEGHLLNGNLLDYRMPTALDLPMIDTILVEVPVARPSLRRARRGRGADRAAAGRTGQRHLPRAGRAHDRAAHVAWQRHAGRLGAGLAVTHDVWIPALHRDLTAGVEQVTVTGETVGALVDELDRAFSRPVRSALRPRAAASRHCGGCRWRGGAAWSAPALDATK